MPVSIFFLLAKWPLGEVASSPLESLPVCFRLLSRGPWRQKGLIMIYKWVRDLNRTQLDGLTLFHGVQGLSWGGSYSSGGNRSEMESFGEAFIHRLNTLVGVAPRWGSDKIFFPSLSMSVGPHTLSSQVVALVPGIDLFWVDNDSRKRGPSLVRACVRATEILAQGGKDKRSLSSGSAWATWCMQGQEHFETLTSWAWVVAQW